MSLLLRFLFVGGVLCNIIPNKGGCETRKCLVESGCGLLYEFDSFPKSPISFEKCRTGKNAFDEFRLCYQWMEKSGGPPFILETKMKHGFNLDDHWMVEHSDHDLYGHDFYDASSAPYLVNQLCENNEGCYYSLRPGGGLTQVHYPILGRMVSVWSQRLHKRLGSGGEDSVGIVRFRVDGTDAIKNASKGSKESFSYRYDLHGYSYAISSNSDVSLERKWMDVVHYYETKDTKYLSKNDSREESLNEYNKKVIHSTKIEVPSYGLRPIDVKDLEIYICSDSHYNPHGSQKRDLNCPKFNLGTTCLCQPSSQLSYRKICVANNAVEYHMMTGAILPGTEGDIRLDCDCKVSSPSPAPPVLVMENKTIEEPIVKVVIPPLSPPENNHTTEVIIVVPPIPSPKEKEKEVLPSLPQTVCRSKFPKLQLQCRDFNREHPDMQYLYLGKVEENIVSPTLNETTRKPIWNQPLVKRESVTTKRNFVTWFNDGPDVVGRKNVVLFSNNQNSSTFGGPSFYPFDNSQSAAHNYYFTCEAHAWLSTGTKGNGPRMVNLTSDGDAWLFLDGKLVIDLGGTHGLMSKDISLDVLEYEDEREIRFDLFYSNRFPYNSTLMVDISSNGCADCYSNTYSSCGVCDGENSDCGLEENGSPSFVEGSEIIKCDENNLDDPCWELGHENLLRKSLGIVKDSSCSVEDLGSGDYEFNFDFVLEYPYAQPSFLLVGLSEYNNKKLRQRGNCDSRTAFPGPGEIPWSDETILWNPERKIGGGVSESNLWNGTTVNVTDDFVTITYTLKTNLSSLLACRESWNDKVLIKKETTNVGTDIYSGTWFLTRVSPVDVNKELKGTFPLYSSKCFFSLSVPIIEDTLVDQVNQQVIWSRSDNPMSGARNSGSGSSEPYDNVNPTSKQLTVKLDWMESYCSSSSDSSNSLIDKGDGSSLMLLDVGFVMALKSCSKIAAPSWWSKLSETTKVVFYHTNGTEGSAFKLQSLGSFGSSDCSILSRGQSEWNCCQKWILYGKDGKLVPPLEGTLKIAWNAELYKTAYSYEDATNKKVNEGIEGDNSVIKRIQVLSELKISVKQPCDSLKNVYCNSSSEFCKKKSEPYGDDGKPSTNIPGTKTISSLSAFYIDPSFSVEWDPEIQGPIPDNARMYGTLMPQLPKLACKYYKPMIMEMRHQSYRRHETSGVVQDNPCVDAIEYMFGNDALNERSGSWITSAEDSGPCFVNFSWVVKKRECRGSSVGESKGGGKPSNSKVTSGEEEFMRMQWDYESQKWILGDPDLNVLTLKRADDGTKKREVKRETKKWDTTKNVLVIVWKLVPVHEEVTSLPTTTKTKRSILQAGGHVFSDPDFPMGHEGEFSTKCPKFNKWDGEKGCCTPDAYVWFLPTEDNGTVWFVAAIFLVFAGVIVLCMCFAFVDGNVSVYQKVKTREASNFPKTTSTKKQKTSVKAYYWAPQWESVTNWWNGETPETKDQQIETKVPQQQQQQQHHILPLLYRDGEFNKVQYDNWDHSPNYNDAGIPWTSNEVTYDQQQRSPYYSNFGIPETNMRYRQ